MKMHYLFKPHQYWNYITEDVYKVLLDFYGDDMLKIVEEEE